MAKLNNDERKMDRFILMKFDCTLGSLIDLQNEKHGMSGKLIGI